MILVADSGSTKTDWKLIDNNSIIETVHTEGINPFHQRKEDIENIITTSALTTMVENVQEVYFYGAGCNYPENIRTMQNAIRSVFRDARIAVEHDLLAASRALCGRSPGIACILGTGSNSCFFDGKDILQNNPSLGYILGDEGGGVYIGKRFMRDFLYGELPKSIEDKFNIEFKVNIDTVLDNIYNKYLPNRYIASFMPFIQKNVDHPYIHGLIYESFYDFIDMHITKYKQAGEHKVHFVGSISYNFKEILQRVVTDSGLILGTVIEQPIHGLVLYHQNKI